MMMHTPPERGSRRPAAIRADPYIGTDAPGYDVPPSRIALNDRCGADPIKTPEKISDYQFT
jgi:hypothetical protein